MKFKPPTPDLEFLKELTSSCRGKGHSKRPLGQRGVCQNVALAGTRQVSPTIRREVGHFTGGALGAHQMVGAGPNAETEYGGGF